MEKHFCSKCDCEIVDNGCCGDDNGGSLCHSCGCDTSWAEFELSELIENGGEVNPEHARIIIRMLKVLAS
jgi:hypothetical protein